MIYVASKTKHAGKWLAYRDGGYPINSTWIDEAGPGETQDFTDLWTRCCLEVNSAKVLVAYREKGEVLKGAFIEIGVALSKPKMVLLAGDWEGFSFAAHPVVRNMVTLNEAMAVASRICKTSSIIHTRAH